MNPYERARQKLVELAAQRRAEEQAREKWAAWSRAPGQAWQRVALRNTETEARAVLTLHDWARAGETWVGRESERPAEGPVDEVAEDGEIIPFPTRPATPAEGEV